MTLFRATSSIEITKTTPIADSRGLQAVPQAHSIAQFGTYYTF